VLVKQRGSSKVTILSNQNLSERKINPNPLDDKILTD